MATLKNMSEAGSSNETPEKTKKEKGGTPKMSKALTTSAKRIQKELGKLFHFIQMNYR